MRLFLFASAALLCAIPLAACSDEPEPQDPSQFQGQTGYGYGQTGYGQQQPGYGQQQPGYGQAQPTATAAPQPTAQPTQGGNTAQPIPPMAAAAAQPLLQNLAREKTAGMNPDGPAFAGNFQQGQILEQQFQVGANKCYAAVGVGLMGVTELDLTIVLHQPPLPEAPVAQDQGTGPQATLADNQNCWRNPTPISVPAKLVMKVSAGQGIAMAQLFSK